MSNRNAFSMTKRTPPPPARPNPDDSSVVNSNISSCRLCDEPDTHEMVQCDRCRGWYHFHCVGVTSDVANVSWQCPNCIQDTTAKSSFNRSTHSSTSSKRRANLMLEKLAREKELEDKFAEDQRKLIEEKERNLRVQNEAAKKRLEQEFDIRETMSDYDEDIDLTSNIIEPQDKNERVTDWLSNPVLLENKIKELVTIPKADSTDAPTEPTAVIVNTSTMDPSERNPPPLIDIISYGEDSQCQTPQDFGQGTATYVHNTNDHLNGVTNVSFDQNVVHQSSTSQTPICQNVAASYSVTQAPPNQSFAQQSTVLSQGPALRSQPSQNHPPFSGQMPQPVGQSANDPSFTGQMTQPAVVSSIPPFISQFQLPQQTFQGTIHRPYTGSLLQSTVVNALQQPFTGRTPRTAVQSSINQPSTGQPSQPIIHSTNYVPLAGHLPTQTTQSGYQQAFTGQLAQPTVQGANHQTIPPTNQRVNNQTFISQPPNPLVYQKPTISMPVYQVSSQAPAPMDQTNPFGFNTQLPCYQPVPALPNFAANFVPSQHQIASRQAMPKELPKFKGEPELWSIFYSSFLTGTTACGLTNAENLGRLQKCLEDPARKMVKNLLTQPEAVREIVETLRMLFGRPEVIIEALIKQLRNDSTTKLDHMDSFIDFAMSVRNVSSEIQVLGMWQYLYNPSLIQELVERLPYEMRISWGEQKLANPHASLSHFSDWLYLRARSACAVTVPQQLNRSDKKSDRKPSSNSASFNAHINSDHSGSSSDTPRNSTNSNKNRPDTCQLCENKSHQQRDCTKFRKLNYDERWEFVKEKKLCRRCLSNHHTMSCKDKGQCGESGCPAKHHRLLHNPAKIETTVQPNPANPANSTIQTNPSNGKKGLHTAHQANKIVIFRRYIPVTLYGPSGSLDVLAFLDDGSDFTLVEERIAETLGIIGTPEDLFLEWTSKIVRKESGSRILTLKISGRQNATKYSLKQVRTVKSLDLPSQTLDVVQLKNTYKFLRRVPLVGYANETPKIIIGLVDCKISTPLKIRSGSWQEPMATKTLLGWEVHGSNSESNTANVSSHFNRENYYTNSDDDLHQMVAKFFSLENFGVKKPEQTIEAQSDLRAKQLLESTTKRIGDGNKFETGLLWKYDEIQLPNSLPMAIKRLESLCRRLERDPDLDMKFRTKMAEYIEKGYVRKLTAEEEALKSPKTWYLPLFPVLYPKKPGKIRLVWDAAATVGETSLNSVLLKGPDQLVSLPGVLLRYREKPYAVTGDIGEMFHREEVRKEDQPAQRFLWREKGSQKIEKYVLLVMSFGAACSPASAQYIKNRNAKEHANEYPRAEEAIRLNHYVDDWLQSFFTEKELLEVAKEVKLVHSKANFYIRNWISNSSEAMSELGGDAQRTEQQINFDLDNPQTERVLGMWWNVTRDTFTYSLRYHPLNKDVLTGLRRPTKREVLRTLMAIYDPLGFLASFLVQLKMLLQDIWRSGIGWDDMLCEKDDDNMYERWLNWIQQLPRIERIQIPRHFSSKINAEGHPRIELHVFVDASLLAYATAAYLRIEDDEGVDCCLVGGKTKVAPLKPLSVPRMELQAAVLGSRYKNFIRENLTVSIQRNVFWSDSSTVLSWLRSDLRKYSQYVGARIGEIIDSTVVNEWRWVPSKLNPADDATKWKGPLSLEPESRWFKGPEFLVQPEEFWPKMPEKIEETNEERKPARLNAHIRREVEVINIKFEPYARWIRTQAFVLRFINNVRAKIGKSNHTVRNGALLREELVSAENTFFRQAQHDEFYREIQQLKDVNSQRENRSIDKRSPLYRYSPYLDQQDILRVRGRIDAAANVSYNQKRPVILPTHHQITELVVKEYHRRYKHQNNETVINEIKQRFMVPRLRALVKRIRRHCQHCKNARAMPVPPQMADLPVGRLSSFTRPFSHVGIDYAGPFKTTMFRRSVKRWIVLFTCLSIRAVHLEYVHSLNTDSCIMAITRFVRKRGSVQEFYSDQGTNFKGADNELNREIRKLDQAKLNVTFTTIYTKWNFNPPLSQYMGGSWERLIGSMKKTLDEILPTTHLPNDETLYTALVEVESIINSRPLTFVSIEPDDPEALTPNHFLLGTSNGDKPPGEFPSSPTKLRGNWRYAQQIANSFWHRWIKEYLPVITRRTKWFENVKPIELHDQVIIVDECSPRNTWERGVVIEAIKTGRNGRISSAKVRTEKGIYTRPVSKLAILDIDKPEAKILNRENLAKGSVTATGDVQMGVE